MANRKTAGAAALFMATALVLAGCASTSNASRGLLDDKTINTTTLEKTNEMVVIEPETTVSVKMDDDSSWSGYYTQESVFSHKGVFIKDRSVTLGAFAIGVHEVTQELFELVMGTNPSFFSSDPAEKENQKRRPVDSVSWYDAIAFCNKLSILQGLEPCYSVQGITDWENLCYEEIPPTNSAVWNAATCDFTKNGYRLPTETEWEFAARGGNPESEAWRCSYAGVDTQKLPEAFAQKPYEDETLDFYAWYAASPGTTHEVGRKEPNTLELHDMSGNVYEWCWDLFGAVTTDAVTDPTGAAFGSFRSVRGGSWCDSAFRCSVSEQSGSLPYSRCTYIGFRLARSLDRSL